MYLPETQGKTLQDIEDYFSGRIASLKQTKKPAAAVESAAAINGENNSELVEKDKLLAS